MGASQSRRDSAILRAVAMDDMEESIINFMIDEHKKKPNYWTTTCLTNTGNLK